MMTIRSEFQPPYLWATVQRKQICNGRRLKKHRISQNKKDICRIYNLDVYEAIGELQGSWRRILAAEQGVDVAYRDYQVEQSQFQLGARTSTDVLLATARLGDAQLRRIRSFADYEITQINLACATGALLGQGQILIIPLDIDTRNP